MQTPLQCAISILGRAGEGEGWGKEGHREKKKGNKTISGDLFYPLKDVFCFPCWRVCWGVGYVIKPEESENSIFLTLEHSQLDKKMVLA